MKEKYSSYMRWALTAISTVTVCLLIFFLFLRYGEFITFLKRLGKILLPVIIGAVLSYLINPIVVFLNRLLTRVLLKFGVSHRLTGSLASGLSIFISLALLLILVYTLLSLILPELYQSISNLVTNFDTYMETFKNWFFNIGFIKDNPDLYDDLLNFVNENIEDIKKFITTELLQRVDKISNLLTGLTSGLISVFNAILDTVVGLIVSVYILSSKRKSIGNAKKITYALFQPQVANTIVHLSSRCNQIFGGFISGKLLDSLIIGMMCFLGLTIFKMPYALLISVIVGITNIIPFFGPFIGAIPSAILVLLSNPTNLKQVLIFIVFIICLQQFDGNILGPKILGDSTGLSALMVVIAILVGGGFFGFLGMILGVPVFAVIQYLLNCFIQYRLTRRELPTDTVNYLDLTSIDTDAGEMHYMVSGRHTANGKQAVYTRRLHRSETTTPTSFTASMQEEIKQKQKRANEAQEAAAHAELAKKEARSSRKRPDRKKPDVQNPDSKKTDVQNPDSKTTDVQNPDRKTTDVQNSGTEKSNPQTTD